MKGLANANRLRLLHDLRSPRSPDVLRLMPSIASGKGGPGRPIAKQAVRRHVDTLRELGVLVELPEERAKAPKYCVDLANLFLFLDRLRGHFAEIEGDDEKARPEMVDGELSEGSFLPCNGSTRTLPLPGNGRRSQVGPRFELVRGLREGAAFTLDAETSYGGEVSWTVGRLPQSDVYLEYDPYVAPVHACVVKRDGGHFLEDVPGNVNGTEHNWRRLGEGERVRLKDADMVGLGRSLLVFRE